MLSRLSDERLQTRVADEAAAIEQVFRMIFLGEVIWSASMSLRREVNRNPDRDKRNDALALLAFAGDLREASPSVRARAEVLRTAGYGAFDGLHMAHAEADRVDALLTTDDRFIRQAGRGLGEPTIRIVNPIDWLQR